jgi:hypothetical protein
MTNNEWSTEVPAEPGFYFATDGTPTLVLVIIGKDDDPAYFYTWQSAWQLPTDEVWEQKNANDIPLKYWRKIVTPERPKA